MDTLLFWPIPAAAVAALAFAWYFHRSMKRMPEGTDRMRHIAAAVRSGAMSYLRQQYKVVGIVFLCLVVLFAVMYLTGALEGSYVQDPGDPEGAILVPCGWPAWVQSFVRGLIRLIPTGQSVLLTGGVSSLAGYGTLIRLSCFWIVLSAVGGSLIFRKTDMK